MSTVMYIACDDCDAESESTDNFDDLKVIAKDEGFRARKEDGEWKNYCADCIGNHPYERE